TTSVCRPADDGNPRGGDAFSVVLVCCKVCQEKGLAARARARTGARSSCPNKGCFFYISIVFVALLLVMDVIKNRHGGGVGLPKELIGAYLTVILAMAGTVAPWMIRNYLEFGTAQITTRASDVISVMWISAFFFRGFLVPSEGQVFSPTTLSKR